MSFAGVSNFTIQFFLISLIISIYVSAQIVNLFENRVNRLRDLVRGHKAFSAPKD